MERKPSLLSTMGLSAVQLLASLRSHGSGEVEVVTVAFTDLEGFTSFTDTHGDSAAAAMISELIVRPALSCAAGTGAW